MHLLLLSVIFIAGEAVRFDANMVPQFTPKQLMNSAPATRAGLTRWAATAHGRELIEYFTAGKGNYEIRITEDADEEGVGRAPQPGLATLIAAGDASKKKSYELVLNPNQPVKPADMMAAAWAGEMLHIYFYSQGISLPHHQRSDFQRAWRAVAAELGMATLTHDDGDEYRRAFTPARVIGLRSLRR